MNNSKLKIAAYLLLIFIAGGLSGGAIIWKTGSRQTAVNPPMGHKPPPGPGAMCDFILNEWKEKIDLTDEQATKVRPILEDGMKEIRALQERSVQQVRETMQK